MPLSVALVPAEASWTPARCSPSALICLTTSGSRSSHGRSSGFLEFAVALATVTLKLPTRSRWASGMVARATLAVFAEVRDFEA